MSTKPPAFTIIDADETTLTLSLPPPSHGPYTIEYMPYGDEWANAKSIQNTVGGQFTIVDLEPANTYQVRSVYIVNSERVEGDEMVLDTGVPGCSGSKKKKKRCSIM